MSAPYNKTRKKTERAFITTTTTTTTTSPESSQVASRRRTRARDCLLAVLPALPVPQTPLCQGDESSSRNPDRPLRRRSMDFFFKPFVVTFIFSAVRYAKCFIRFSTS
ncbi:hypothetical protein PUN28_000553 [Cardiocondyla obscurior]|uniref:Uncharacterized protein n=1 Tax=Cardiocondyla obscurior TaxID=286306 RepID=A0AAW2H036_9HYME